MPKLSAFAFAFLLALGVLSCVDDDSASDNRDGDVSNSDAAGGDTGVVESDARTDGTGEDAATGDSTGMDMTADPLDTSGSDSGESSPLISTDGLETACSNDVDRPQRTSELYDDITSCAFTCDLDDEECFYACVEDDFNLTEDCTVCFAAWAECARRECADICTSGTGGPCSACVQSACTGVRRDCAGPGW